MRERDTERGSGGGNEEEREGGMGGERTENGNIFRIIKGYAIYNSTME